MDNWNFRGIVSRLHRSKDFYILYMTWLAHFLIFCKYLFIYTTLPYKLSEYFMKTCHLVWAPLLFGWFLFTFSIHLSYTQSAFGAWAVSVTGPMGSELRATLRLCLNFYYLPLKRAVQQMMQRRWEVDRYITAKKCLKLEGRHMRPHTSQVSSAVRISTLL